MSISDWRSYFATTGWGVAAILAVVLGCVLFSNMVALRPGPRSVDARTEQQQAKADGADAKPRPAIQEPYAAKYKEYCGNGEKPNDCVIPLRAAEAAEQQAFYAWVGLLLVGPTIFLSAIGLWLVKRTLNETAKAAVAAADTARIAEEALAASQRPWVSVEVTIESGLKIENDDGRIQLQLRLRNSGLSPATNVQIRTQICGSTDFHIAIAEMSKEARELAQRRRGVPLGKMIGFSLFPDEITFQDATPRLTPSKLIRAVPRTPGVDEPGVVIQIQTSPVVVGLVSYVNPISRADHQTGFMYVLWHVPRGVRTLIPMQDGVHIPRNDLVLQRNALGGYVD